MNEKNNRIIKLWDITKLDKEIYSLESDTAKNIGIPFVNGYSKLLYVFGKEEKPIYIYVYDYNINQITNILKLLFIF